MRRARVPLALCMLALLPLAGCVDAWLDEGVDEAVDDAPANPTPWNGTNATTPPTEDDASPPPPATPAPTPPPAPTAPPTPPPPAPPPASPPPAPTADPTPAPPPTPTPTPATPPPSEPWPREGSFVRYTLRVGQAFANSLQQWETFADLSWTYRDGDWHGECEARTHERLHDGTWDNRTERRTYSAQDPPHWPLMNTRSPPPIGSEVRVWYARGCLLDQETLLYAGTDTEPAPVNGATVTAPTHRAEDGNPPEQPMDWRTEWSTTTGLVIHWSYARGGTAPHTNAGRLVDTDAPLA